MAPTELLSSYPNCLLACLLSYLLACCLLPHLLVCLLACLLPHLLASSLTCLLACLPACPRTPLDSLECCRNPFRPIIMSIMSQTHARTRRTTSWHHALWLVIMLSDWWLCPLIGHHVIHVLIIQAEIPSLSKKCEWPTDRHEQSDKLYRI